jgi:hypothetical protein
MKYAKKYCVKYIFLLACYLNKYHPRNKEDIYKGIKFRIRKSPNIYFINASCEDIDILLNYDLQKLYKFYIIKGYDINTLIKDYVNYCKIDILKSKSKIDILDTILHELDNLLDGKDVIDYDSYNNISKSINIE